MACIWMRRAALVLASGAALLLASCGGGGSIVSQLVPTRMVVFGDAFSDQGQTGGKRYTVNGATFNIWTETVAAGFGVPLVAAALPTGTAYAQGNARIVAEPDAAGSTATLTVKEQIDGFLAGTTISQSDLLVVSGGISDIVVQMQAVRAGTQTAQQMLANVAQAGRDLAAQARRLTSAGATHVVVVGTFNLGKTPYAIAIGQSALLTEASSKFNEELLVALVDQGNNMLYVDAALFFNLMANSPASYGIVNAVDPVCTTVDPGPGIGIGAGEINSHLCTTTTIAAAAGTNFNSFLFADKIYPTPLAHRRFGEYALQRIAGRW